MDQMDLGDFTVEVWFKALSAPDTWSRFFGFGKGRPGVFLSFLIDSRTGNDIGGLPLQWRGCVDFGSGKKQKWALGTMLR